MVALILRRLALTVPMLVGVALLVFMMLALSPGGLGGAGGADLESVMAPGVRAYYEERYGLDDPPLLQFGRWLGRLSPLRTAPGEGLVLRSPDLGRSFVRGRPVADLIGEALPITLLLNLVAMTIVFAIGIPSGLLAGARRGGWFDRVSGGLSITLWSIPIIWACVMVLGFFASSRGLGLFPVGGLHSPGAESMRFLPSIEEGAIERGYVLDALWHLVLPLSCLVYAGFAPVARQVRSGITEAMGADFVMTARAKGVPERDVVLRHVFRSNLLALITLITGVVPALLSGSIIVESVFDIPGMGMLVLDAVVLRDRELLLGVVVIVGAVNILALLAADVLMLLADPRIRLSGGAT